MPLTLKFRGQTYHLRRFERLRHWDPGLTEGYLAQVLYELRGTFLHGFYIDSGHGEYAVRLQPMT